MAGMRDTLIHGYATIDLRIVWTTVQEELPSLTGQVRALRDELDGEYLCPAVFVVAGAVGSVDDGFQRPPARLRDP
jgi:hypothetical protein